MSLTTTDKRHHLFNSVLGSGRGLDSATSLARDYADLDVDTLLENGSTADLAFAFFRFRDLAGADRLHEYLSQRSADDIYFGWGDDFLPAAMSALGLGSRRRSPWLHSEEHRNHALGEALRTIHIADLHPHRIWVGDDANPETLKEIRSLCGADAARLNTPLVSKRRSHHLPRGTWRSPSKMKAERCLHCASLAQGLIIPALDEYNSGGFSVTSIMGSPSTYNDLLARLLDHERTYADVLAAANEQTRALVLTGLTTLCSQDPLPIVMASLSVRERQGLVRFAFTDLHAKLATMDWEGILDLVLPPTFDSPLDSKLLHQLLFEASSQLSY